MAGELVVGGYARYFERPQLISQSLGPHFIGFRTGWGYQPMNEAFVYTTGVALRLHARGVEAVVELGAVMVGGIIRSADDGAVLRLGLRLDRE